MLVNDSNGRSLQLSNHFSIFHLLHFFPFFWGWGPIFRGGPMSGGVPCPGESHVWGVPCLGGLPMSGGSHVWGGHIQAGPMSRGVPCLGGTMSGGVAHVWGVPCPGGSHVWGESHVWGGPMSEGGTPAM